MKLNIDNLDRSILNLIQCNADLTLKELGAKLGNMPATTISGRLKKLRQQEVILNSMVQLDMVRLGLIIRGVMYLNLKDISSDNIAAFAEQLLKINGVIKCEKVIGERHFMIEVITKDVVTFNEINQQIANIDTVYNIQSYIILKEIIPNKGVNL